jgi:hypothetical protein
MIDLETPIRNDFYIKLASEADTPTALAAFYRQDTETTVDDETGEETVTNVGDPYLVKHSPDHAIDIVGVIYEPTGDMLTDGEGNQYPETAPIDGWHINIRLSGDARRADVEAIDALYGVTPNSPSRVWL